MQINMYSQIIYSNFGFPSDAVSLARHSLKKILKDIYNNLGISLIKLHKYQEAITCFEKAIKINSNFETAHNNLGNAYQELGKYQEAISCYQRAISIKPNYTEAHYNLGNVFQAIGRYQEAISCNQKVIKINPLIDKLKELKNSGKFIVGYAGSHGFANPLDTIINACILLKEKSDIIFFLVGDGPEKNRIMNFDKSLKNRDSRASM